MGANLLEGLGRAMRRPAHRLVVERNDPADRAAEADLLHTAPARRHRGTFNAAAFARYPELDLHVDVLTFLLAQSSVRKAVRIVWNHPSKEASRTVAQDFHVHLAELVVATSAGAGIPVAQVLLCSGERSVASKEDALFTELTVTADESSDVPFSCNPDWRNATADRLASLPVFEHAFGLLLVAFRLSAHVSLLSIFPNLEAFASVCDPLARQVGSANLWDPSRTRSLGILSLTRRVSNCAGGCADLANLGRRGKDSSSQDSVDTAAALFGSDLKLIRADGGARINLSSLTCS